MEDTSSPSQDDETPLRRNWLSRLFKSSPSSETNTTQSQARETMINAADRFHVLRVDDVMVPRADIVAVDQTSGLHDLSIAFQAAGHSRMPVYKETLDDPVGMVHIKDILGYLMLNARGRSAKTYKDRKIIPTIKRTVLYVPPSMLAQDLLRRMQARRIHMAIVVDEYGGTDGIVTLEDLVEPIVGDIEDEHDEDTPLLTQRSPTLWEADARMEIEDFATETGIDLQLEDYEDEIDTLGGIAFALAGRVPERGEILRHPRDIDIEIMDADSRRIRRMKLRKVETT